MNTVFICALYATALLFLLASLLRDRRKTRLALKKAVHMFAGVLPQFISVLLFSGLLLALLPPQAIGRLLGREAGLGGMLFSALVGAVALVPVMVVFPLVGQLLEDGAGIAQMAVFISTLTTVGIVTLPMEIRYWGKKAALLRNLLAFLAAFLIACGLEVLLK